MEQIREELANNIKVTNINTGKQYFITKWELENRMLPKLFRTVENIFDEIQKVGSFKILEQPGVQLAQNDGTKGEYYASQNTKFRFEMVLI